MDPVITTIIGALAGSASRKIFDESYNTLKALLNRKFGNDSEVAKAIDRLEAKPESQGRKRVLEEELLAVKAHEDREVQQAAQALQSCLTFASCRQVAVGNNIAQVDNGGTAQVTIKCWDRK